jgi:hypothetical protein
MSLPGFLSEEEHFAQPSKLLPCAPDQNNPPEKARGRGHKSARVVAAAKTQDAERPAKHIAVRQQG